jgi:hypothetical protein
LAVLVNHPARGERGGSSRSDLDDHEEPLAVADGLWRIELGLLHASARSGERAAQRSEVIEPAHDRAHGGNLAQGPKRLLA